MRRHAIAAAVIAGGFAIAATPAGAMPQRVVSLNLCADQLLLALADRSQIAALSALARDPGASAAAETAEGLPQTRGTAEEALALAPDLVFLGPLDRLGTGRVLAARGVRVERLALPASLAEARALVRQTAALLGHPGRGEALARQLDIPPPQEGRAPSALPYERRGYASGPQSILGELIGRAGFLHAGPGAGLGGFVSLETVVARRPEVLIVGSGTTGAGDQGAALLAHPALARLYPAERRILVPDALTVCPGPGFLAAVDRLRRARAVLSP
ncbi:MAG: ABC transporter substrate-binding protein [Phreatobacter sp.]|uniref:ABC transporter substrate-binding protein n=1 Tax=Phreatobacter sp. TaxID=1966341 RepID=UPI0027328765|nr:ABC transporter substrate-binding protein [Phreatobacter sp.]MDP2802318.1 ABC transporter substrate-binding protein [Phreatobacter sp.]